MGSSLRNRLYQILAIALVAGMCYLAYIVVHGVFDLNKEQLTVVGAVAVALTSYLGTRSIERRKVLEASIREKKTAMYEEFIVFTLRFMVPGTETPSEDEMQEFFARMTPAMVAYASNGFIRAWGTFRIGSDGRSPAETLKGFEELLKAIRNDLGLRSTFLADNALLRLFVNDV
jgi:hypothetical protein